MNKCPNCGHEWPDDKRASGGRARWQGVSKKQRTIAARKAALAMHAKRRANTLKNPPGESGSKVNE